MTLPRPDLRRAAGRGSPWQTWPEGSPRKGTLPRDFAQACLLEGMPLAEVRFGGPGPEDAVPAKPAKAPAGKLPRGGKGGDALAVSPMAGKPWQGYPLGDTLARIE